jgi:hypothetical protein
MSVRFVVRTSLLPVLGVALVLSVARAGNPADVKVGDWVSYKMTAGPISGITLKMTVTARDDKEATLRVEGKFGEKEMPAKEQKVPLDQLTDPTRTITGGPAGLAPARVKPKVDVKKVEEADEKITVGGKEYACKRLKLQTTAELKGKTIESVRTVWVSKDVPLSGMVKTVSETGGIRTMMELTGSGRGK